MNIELLKRKLLVKYPFFGSIIAHSNCVVEPSIETAGTDGTNIYYNPNYMETLTEDEQIFVFAHEISHIAFSHMDRSAGKDRKLWNIATDAVVNAFLKQDGLTAVKGIVDMEDAIDYDAEEMYQKLLAQKQQDGKQGNQSDESKTQSGQSNSNSSSNNTQNVKEEKQGANHDVGHDTHSMWNKAIEKKQKEQLEESSEKSSTSNEFKDFLDKISKMFSKKKEKSEQQPNEKVNQEDIKNEEIKKITELGEKRAFQQNKVERKKQLEELRQALIHQSQGHGSDTNSKKINITDIGISEPLIDWRMLLKEAVQYDVDWSYQNAGIEDGVVTAYLEEIPRPETEIVLDTSDSINETLLRNFLRECKNILQNSKVKVGCFDTKFYGFTEIKQLSDIDYLPFYGRGGTNFEVAVNAFTRRVENKIIFTDGKAPMPTTNIDAIWIVFGNHKIQPKGGKVIYINAEQLQNLASMHLINDKGRSR